MIVWKRADRILRTFPGCRMLPLADYLSAVAVSASSRRAMPTMLARSEVQLPRAQESSRKFGTIQQRREIFQKITDAVLSRRLTLWQSSASATE